MTDRDAWKYGRHGGSPIYDDDGELTQWHPDYGMPAAKLGYRSFLAKCVLNEIWEKEYDKEIISYTEKWHTSKNVENLELHEYLGMTWNEYTAYYEGRSTLKQIVDARKYELKARG